MKITKAFARRGTITAIAAAAVMTAVPAANAAAPSTATPQTIIGGGGGWEFTGVASGNCGVTAVGANALGGGNIDAGAQVESFDGAIIGGTVNLTAYNTTSGTKTLATWDPSSAAGNWISPNVFAHYLPGQYITITLTGSVLTAGGGYCEVYNPTTTFKVS
jgi:hypothetical protein